MLVLVMVEACSGGDWCSNSASAQCDRDVRCGMVDPRLRSTCIARRIADCKPSELQAALGAGHTSFVASEGDACLQALANQSCDDLRPEFSHPRRTLPAACLRAFAGKLKTSASCAVHEACESTICEVPRPGLGGDRRCQVADARASCETDLHCPFETVCHRNSCSGNEGQTCNCAAKATTDCGCKFPLTCFRTAVYVNGSSGYCTASSERLLLGYRPWVAGSEWISEGGSCQLPGSSQDVVRPCMTDLTCESGTCRRSP